MTKQLSLIASLLMLSYSNIHSQNILPNYGFERHNVSVSNMIVSKGVFAGVSDAKHVIDSCDIFLAQYYNKTRAEGCFESEEIAYKTYLPYRGISSVNMIVAASGGSVVVFKLREGIEKDSVYYFKCFVKSSSKITIPNLLNIAYISKLESDYIKIREYSMKSPVLKPSKNLESDRQWVQLSGRFKATSDANYFIVFLDPRVASLCKSTPFDFLLDNVSLEKTNDTSLLGVFNVEKLKAVNFFNAVISSNDSVIQPQIYSQMRDLLITKKDYLIRVEYPPTALGLKRKGIIQEFFKKFRYESLRITYVEADDKKLRGNVNVGFY